MTLILHVELLMDCQYYAMVLLMVSEKLEM